MFQYVIRRIALFIPTLFLITVICFGISRMAPGDPAELKAGVGSEGAQRGNQQLNEQIIKQIRAQWHLDQPIWYWSLFSDEKDAEGELKPLSERLQMKWNGTHNQYHLWMGDILKLDFGKSFQDQRPVIDKIAERLPITASLAIISEFFAILIAIPIGIYSARKQRENSTLDKGISTTLFILYSLPTFWIGTMLIIFFGGGDFLAWFPNNGLHGNDYPYPTWWENTVDLIWHVALPLLSIPLAADAWIDAGSDSSGLHSYRTSKGPIGKSRCLQARASQFADPDHYDPGWKPSGTHRRFDRHRNDLLCTRAWPAAV
jgi:peptide/nickel transport system permease protein